MNKRISLEEAVSKIHDGATIMVGGFYRVGTPAKIVDEILRQGIKDLTIINNDLGTPDSALGRLIYSGNVKKVIFSWCGYMSRLPEMAEKGEIEIEPTPQGTLIERIRCGGYGLGGVLTTTGLGTIIEEKGYGVRVNLNNEEYLYHTPLRADFTIVEAYEADEAGNLVFRRTQRNFNDTMCYAGDTVIASVVKTIKKKGEIDPDSVMVQGPLVDFLVQEEE